MTVHLHTVVFSHHGNVHYFLDGIRPPRCVSHGYTVLLYGMFFIFSFGVLRVALAYSVAT